MHQVDSSPLRPSIPQPCAHLRILAMGQRLAAMLSGKISDTQPGSKRKRSTSDSGRRIWQPLHPTVRTLLDPEYVQFHDKYAQYVEPEQVKGWNPGLRSRFTWPYAGSPVLNVGEVKDIRPCPNFTIRVFTPKGDPPTNGWPVVLWMHGGAFAVGNIDSDNDLCSLMCRDAQCVVLNIDYRLAPEHPFPAALQDCVDTLEWCASPSGAEYLNTNRRKVVIGGVSAGGNLAAALTLIAVELAIPILLQLLVVPVIDNTADLKTSWGLHPHAPWLTPARMLFYRNLYLPDPAHSAHWKASPILAPPELLSRLPTTWMAVAEQDMLSVEGILYTSLLQQHGVTAHCQTYVGMPHGMMALSGESHILTFI